MNKHTTQANRKWTGKKKWQQQNTEQRILQSEKKTDREKIYEMDEKKKNWAHEWIEQEHHCIKWDKWSVYKITK